ncbi:uncharacterized protein LOC131429191 [Malaya genurostris]|uniref:uncharacterized protein LOC131429191 n=1 Tax=Malaya genurostris TaxID=325434 RepID=UPI0026F38D69|nr:uncharacterized protein LOC131429191 [Malaya genurostris]
MDLSALPLELTWMILDQVKSLPHRKNGSLVCKAWNRMLLTSRKSLETVNLRICSRNRGPEEDEKLFNELCEIMVSSNRNYVNIEFFYVNFEIPVVRDFLHFIVTVCSESIKSLKFICCYGLYRSDLLVVLRTAGNLEDLHLQSRVGYDDIEIEEFKLPKLRKLTLHMEETNTFYQGICLSAMQLRELDIKTRDGCQSVRQAVALIQRFCTQLTKLSLDSEGSLTNEECDEMEFPKLTTMSLKISGPINQSIFRRLRRLKNLKIDGIVTDEVICAISKILSLESLSIRCKSLMESHKFVQMTFLKNLHTLHLRGISKFSWNNVVLPKLTNLHVNSTGEGFLEFLKRSNLTSLEIHDSAMTNKQLKRMCRHLSQVQRLELAFCGHISDSGLKYLNQLGKLTELWHSR